MRLSVRTLLTSVAVVVASLEVASAPALAQSAALNPPYFMVSPPVKVSETDKVEVAEVFSYACPHCFQFQDRVDAWRAKLDTKKVEFLYVPSPYNELDTLLARGFFAADSLGVVAKTHHAIFQAIHERGVQVRTLNDVVALYAQFGVPADKFSKAINDFYVQTQVKRTYDLMLKYKIDGTPTLIVAGKYRITTDSAGGQENMFKVVDRLIAQELAQKSDKSTGQSTSTSRQAPSSGK